jgi:alkaline phosphatase D
VARFRVEDWDAGRDWEYRVRYEGDRGTPWTYRGLVRADPDAASDGSSGFGVGLLGCLRASARQLESAPAASSTRPPFGTLGRYTDENLYFPFDALVDNLRRRDPDLLVFTGDQLYETSPTRAVAGDPTLDYLYKWLLWCWSFGELTRRTPTVVLVDDHDVYQPNVWGAGGVVTDDGYNLGGYTERPEFVNTVQRTQCGHNPDAHDPRPVENGIEVYYGAFRYGGVEFAVLEDRKFKSPPPRGRVGDAGPPTGELLGERQESFLADWADRVDAGTPRICLTQTTLAAVQTTPDGVAMTDFDANGYPSPGRDRAVELLRDAGALVLSGDQHLASLIRHGLDGPADGVVQFNGPAGAATFQRWFEPRRALPNARAEPNTGDFTDAFGNAVRVLAVANPRIAFDRLRRLRGGWSQVVGDRGLKREGYGFVAVDPDAGEYVVECWPYDVDPSDGEQYAGWPYRLGFDEATGPPE